MKITTEQNKYLKGLAHSLSPSVSYGKQGVTESLIDEIKRSLEAHELIKVKFQKDKDGKSNIAEQIVEKTDSHLVAILGNMLVLYKPTKRTEDRKIKLP